MGNPGYGLGNGYGSGFALLVFMFYSFNYYWCMFRKQYGDG